MGSIKGGTRVGRDQTEITFVFWTVLELSQKVQAECMATLEHIGVHYYSSTTDVETEEDWEVAYINGNENVANIWKRCVWWST
jgi:hypothetical protein